MKGKLDREDAEGEGLLKLKAIVRVAKVDAVIVMVNGCRREAIIWVDFEAQLVTDFQIED